MTILKPLSLRNDVRRHLRELFAKYMTRDMVVYDIGCGIKPFSGFLEGRVRRYIGVDVNNGFYDNKYIDIVGSATVVPVNDGVAGAVISSQVIEHLDKPLDAIRESHRLLSANGILFLSCPLLYPIHSAPCDYYRYTEHAIERMLGECGFRVLEKRDVGGFWYCLGFFLGLYIQPLDRGVLRRMRLVRAVDWLMRSVFASLHALEGLMLRLAGRCITDHRRKWAVNYVYAAMKLNVGNQKDR